MVSQSKKSCNGKKSTDNLTNFSSNADIAIFTRFLRHTKLQHMLASLPDSRQQAKTKYSNVSLLMWALSVYFFRVQSKNALNVKFKDLHPSKKCAFSRFIG